MARGYDYNLIVIGGGSAGLFSAQLAASLRAKVALIERGKMGGDCLHTGCVPSKALLKTAKIFSLRHRAADFGIKSISMEMDFSLVMERIRRVIGEIQPANSVERCLSLGISCYEGSASILSPREVVVNGKLLRTRAILVATGARPVVPEIEGLAAMNPLTSDTVWDLPSLPSRLLVLGGGVIGCELAQAFQRLGSKVTLVERNSRVLSREDEEVGEALGKRFEEEGMRLVLGAGTLRFFREGEEKFVECENGTRIGFDQVIVALGRRPNTEGLGLAEAGVRLRPNGCIETDLSFRTSVPSIYACGDVTGPLQFTHFANLSAEIATRNALFSSWRIFRRRADISVFPWAVFTDPELGRVGLNETEAKARGLRFTERRFNFSGSDRALTEDEARGFVKILSTRNDRILGATIMGPLAGELIQEIALAMKHGLGLQGIREAVHAYPTLMEANHSAAAVGALDRQPDWLASFHRAWRRLP